VVPLRKVYNKIRLYCVNGSGKYNKKMEKRNLNNYKVMIEQDEDGAFVASVPALPGCHSQGKTIVELKRNIKDAIKLCLKEATVNPVYRKRIKNFAYEPSLLALDTVTL